MRDIRNLSTGPVRLFRNHVGAGIMIQHRDNQTRQAIIAKCSAVAESMGGLAYRTVFGLSKGSGDLIGLRKVVIGPEHIGMTIAQFVSLEVKTPTGSPSEEQKQWLDFVKNCGGVAEIVRSVEQAKKVVDMPLLG